METAIAAVMLSPLAGCLCYIGVREWRVRRAIRRIQARSLNNPAPSSMALDVREILDWLDSTRADWWPDPASLHTTKCPECGSVIPVETAAVPEEQGTRH